MGKFGAYAFPILVIALFVTVMNLGPWLKRPWNGETDVDRHLQNIQRLVLHRQWCSASTEWQDTLRDYKKVVHRLQFSVERDELNRIDDLLARIQGAVLTKDKQGAVEEIFEARQHWRQLGK